MTDHPPKVAGASETEADGRAPRFKRRRLAGAAIAVLVIAGMALAFGPATRTVVADQFVCLGCRQKADYATSGEGARSKVHRATKEGGETTCAECHVMPSWSGSAFVYSHYVAGTDLFGHFPDRRAQRHGAAVTPTAAKAYRVRDRLVEYDSNTCRTCHIESEIKPKRKRGRNAHKNALVKKETCILCHYNLVHIEVPLREESKE